jgi:pimeloyl-ACP methyl ester carboxylesterase
VLITPFDSMLSVASRHYSFVPVRWLLRHPFRSDEWAAGVHVPVLVLAADRDAVIPPSHARALFEVWNGPKEFRLLKGVGHNDVQTDPNYYRLINDFLANVNRGVVQPAHTATLE